MSTNANRLAVNGGSATYDYKLWQVILASSAGTMIEWYDFYLFGSLTAILATQFFPGSDPVISVLSWLAVFAVGFIVRPFGAIVFGRVGDLIGRKYAFLVTLTIMGLATAAIGIIPTYAVIGILAPIIMVVLRILQGLALGGEYGGAAVYVAEHSADRRRGFFTSWIQTTATVGLALALIVILVCRVTMGEAAFKDWGWRIPFWVSFFLVLMSIYIRLRLRESPLFSRLKSAGKSSKSPLKDSFGSGKNWKLILLALFGATAGQAVVWYTGQFYALFFLQNVLKVDFIGSNLIVFVALLVGTPFFIVFGALSDRIGRKPIIMWGCLLAAITYLPIYFLMNLVADPANNTATRNAAGALTTVSLTPVNAILMFVLVLIQVLYVTMVYGPIAAFLVELFPAKIRYTSLSLPYHIGNGWFGGLTPLIASAIVAATGLIYAGLSYPIIVALVTFFVGTFLITETFRTRIWDEVAEAEEGEFVAPDEPVGRIAPQSLSG